MFKNKKEKKKERFVTKSEQGIGLGFIEVIVDTETGVNYLCTGGATPESIIPLLDKDGKVVIDDISDTTEE